MSYLSRFLIIILTVVVVPTTQAGFFDKLKEKTSEVLDSVKDVKETVVITREVVRETDTLADSVQYYDAYAPTPAEVRLLQSRLNELGYDTGRPDGRMGKRTRDAIKLYQRSSGANADGAINYALFQEITSGRGPRIEAPTLSKAEWKQYQQMLNDLGYNAGRPDGLPGKRTKNAVARFLSENNLPPSQGMDRNGFKSIRKILYGETSTGQVGNGQAGIGQQGTSYSNVSDTGILSAAGQNSGQLASAAVVENRFDSENAYVIGKNREENVRAWNAIALLVLSKHPELIDNRETLKSWFDYEGRTVTSQYLLEEALNEFAVEIRQRPVPEVKNLLVYKPAVMQKGQYNTTSGLFAVGAGRGNEVIRLPHLPRLSLVISGLSQAPYINTDTSQYGEKYLGVPMSLEQAIDLEGTRMAKSSRLNLTLVAGLQVEGIKLRPSDNDAGYSITGELTGPLATLTANIAGPRGEVIGDGEELYRWKIETKNQLAKTESSVKAIAARYGMAIVEGHLDPSQGKNSSFMAALALGKQPELIDKWPQAFVLAQQMLTRDEKIDVFGGSNTRFDQLDSVAQSRVHEAIKDRYREVLISRALPIDLPLLVSHRTDVGSYQPESNLFPLSPRDTAYTGVHKFIATGGSFQGTAYLGDRWLPESVSISGEPALQLREQLFGTRSGQSASAVHARFGNISDVSVRFEQSRGYRSAGQFDVRVELDVTREVLISAKNQIVYEFPAVHPKQERFSEVMAAFNVPLASSMRIIGSAMAFGETAQFKDKYIRSSSIVSDANEFNRDEKLQEAVAYVESRMVDTGQPLWLAGHLELGEYDLNNGSFKVLNVTFSEEQRYSPSDGHNFRGRIVNQALGAVPPLEVDRARAEQIVRGFPANSRRSLEIRARVVPLGAITDLGRSNSYGQLTVTHQIKEIFVLRREERSTRQQWQLLGHIAMEDVSPVKTAKPVQNEITLSEKPVLDQDLLLLLAAQSAGSLSDESWDWLMRNRWAYDNGVATTLGVTFFDEGAPFPDRSTTQVLRPGFISWVKGLKIPQYQNVALRLNLGRRMGYHGSGVVGTSPAGPLAGLCNVASSEVSLSGGGGVETFDKSPDQSKVSSVRNNLMQTKTGRFTVEPQARAGYKTLASASCHALSKNAARSLPALANPPAVTVELNALAHFRDNSAKMAVVDASVTSVAFADNGGGIPRVVVSLEFQHMTVSDSYTDGGQILHSLSAADIAPKAPKAPEQKDQRIQTADIVEIKLGVPLASAVEAIEAHFETSSRYAIRRGFTTNPKQFENADLWVNETGNEYIAVFYEGDVETANVLGVIRGLRLPGIDFDRETALQMLRSKYGKEQIVEADRHLKLVWGKYVDDWPEDTGDENAAARRAGISGTGGACSMNWAAGSMPQRVEDASGASVELRTVLTRSRGQGIYLRWPSLRNYAQPGPDVCDFYLEAYHDDKSDPEVFVGMFDIQAYQQAFADASVVTTEVSDQAADTVKPKSVVKF